MAGKKTNMGTTIDEVRAMIRQTKGNKFTPSVIYMRINGRVINVLNPKYKKEVMEYLKIPNE